eukprot:CAMPEP_0197629666 /NCGR_PEP_ID=MMETSP1338-20131121/7427_1 /TAXON_ID=43686 ORGANISM="Pelagodinium beii, Strain RCC1491" /NCGR_SAMPLE_ID=MMETSP1338 /ASSEMBLY_ACC=CAM_ASM_000754 /LENGTH=41 /DNA_ID= /DNA_START= /DNA_END= /DNA_ORIENTATION=
MWAENVQPAALPGFFWNARSQGEGPKLALLASALSTLLTAG